MILLKNLLEKTNTWKVYCDLDGVLTDFEHQLKTIGIDDGHEFEKKYGTDIFWKKIGDGGLKWWSEMPWMKDGKILWSFIKNYDVEILSAPARNPLSSKGKKIWVKKHLGNIKLNLDRAQNKKDYANSNSVLIDDQEKNIKQWISSGGVGILHKSASNTIKKLKEIGI